MKSFWHVSTNYGDQLTPYIIGKITGIKAIYTEPSENDVTYILTGSILGPSIGNSVIWGAGIAWRHQEIYGAFPITKNHKVLATRGPISQQRIVECGGPKSRFLGDPALILPRIYNPQINKDVELGVIPSWVDYVKAKEYYGNECLVIDVTQPVESVLNDILRCKMTISSALHGLITSAAYGIPTHWVELSDIIIGDKTKYHDFLLTTKNGIYDPLDIRDKVSIETIINSVRDHTMTIDLDSFYGSFPFII